MNALCETTRRFAPLCGRVLIAFIFLRSGVGKIGNFSAVAGNMAAKGMPYAEFLLVCAIAIEIGGGLCVLLGWKAQWGALIFIMGMGSGPLSLSGTRDAKH